MRNGIEKDVRQAVLIINGNEKGRAKKTGKKGQETEKIVISRGTTKIT